MEINSHSQEQGILLLNFHFFQYLYMDILRPVHKTLPQVPTPSLNIVIWKISLVFMKETNLLEIVRSWSSTANIKVRLSKFN